MKMKTLLCLLTISCCEIILAPGLGAQTVTGSGDPDYIPLWISTSSGGGGGGNEEDVGTTTVLNRTNMYYIGGKLGLGTTYPLTKLQVVGDVIMGDSWDRIVTGHWYNDNPNNEIGYLGFNMLQLTDAEWHSKGDGTFNGGGLFFGTTHGDLHFSSIPSTGGSPETRSESTIQNNVKMTITPGGRIGINTKTPTQALEVCHRDTTGGININQLDTSLKKSEIKFSIGGVGHWSLGHYLSSSRPKSFFIWNQNRQATEFFIADNGMTGINTEWPCARLDVNGDFKASAIGIGTNPPSPSSPYKLFVEGGIKAREIRVTVSAFADHVFDKDYSLISIPDLESFISANHRLPGIPSAREVFENDGIEIGAMQVRLLEKIEEQSLYIISLQHQIDELKSLISSAGEEKR
ncbi:MAG: hypothetical protein Q8M08_02900 [Bacteroidales bacterium]|nr:hypothetical protein [Bacteroidales bacterium]